MFDAIPWDYLVITYSTSSKSTLCSCNWHMAWLSPYLVDQLSCKVTVVSANHVLVSLRHQHPPTLAMLALSFFPTPAPQHFPREPSSPPEITMPFSRSIRITSIFPAWGPDASRSWDGKTVSRSLADYQVEQSKHILPKGRYDSSIERDSSYIYIYIYTVYMHKYDMIPTYEQKTKPLLEIESTKHRDVPRHGSYSCGSSQGTSCDAGPSVCLGDTVFGAHQLYLWWGDLGIQKKASGHFNFGALERNHKICLNIIFIYHIEITTVCL